MVKGKKVSYTIHSLERAVVDISLKDQIAFYDANNGGHGVIFPLERFWKLVDVVKKETEKKNEETTLWDTNKCLFCGGTGHGKDGVPCPHSKVTI